MTNRQPNSNHESRDNRGSMLNKLMSLGPFKRFKKKNNSSDSDNEKDCIDEMNARFKFWSKSKKKKHLLSLWRKAYFKALGVVYVFNLNDWMQIKLKLFGGHLLNY